MTDKIIRCLKIIIGDRSLHACWLNTLSLLEHIGSRKMIKCLNSEHLTLSMLEHICEEARHALHFKRLSERIYEGHCPDFTDCHLLLGRSAQRYFQGVDHMVEQQLSIDEGEVFNYLYVTYLVEVRALWLYQIYDELLRQLKAGINLRPVLVEEEKHLSEVQQFLRYKDASFTMRENLFLVGEKRLFQQFLTDLEQYFLNDPSYQAAIAGRSIDMNGIYAES